MTAISEDKLETTYVDQSNKLRDLFIQHYGLNVGSDRVLVDNTILTIDKFEPRRYLYEARIVDISVTPLNNNNLYNVKFSLVSTGHTYLITAHPELKKECQETKFYEGTVHFMYFSFLLLQVENLGEEFFGFFLRYFMQDFS